MDYSLPHMKKALYSIALIILVFTFFAISDKRGFWSEKALVYSNMTREPYVPPKKISVRLTIVYDKTHSETYDTQADEGDTAFNLLRTVAAKEGFDLEIANVPNSPEIIVEQIRDTRNVDGANWNYEINGEPQSVNPNTRKIKQGDTVTFIYGN